MILKCPQCHESRIVSECRGHLEYCSVKCLVASRLLDVAQITRMAKHYSQVAAANVLGIPYSTFRRKLYKQNLLVLFQK